MTSFADRPLEEQIAQWRAFVRRRHTLHGPDVEELEGHLRDQLVALTETGLVGDEAFLVAVKRMGNLDALSREFAREHSERLWKQLVMSPTPDAADDSPNTARAHTVVVLILTVTAALAVKIPDLLMRFFSEHPGITLVGANMVAMWLPFGAHFQEASGSCGYADRLGMPRNASECPCYIIRQGRNPCPTCDVPHIRESPVLIGTNATLVVAPTGFEPVFQP